MAAYTDQELKAEIRVGFINLEVIRIYKEFKYRWICTMPAHFLGRGALTPQAQGRSAGSPLSPSLTVKYSSILHLKDYHVHEALPYILVVLCLAHRG